jgi:NADH-quinone oxidoreductase subunit L
MYHLTTHAFFKALLFLGAGSIIHAMHHEQNIWKMGALKEKLPVTFWTFFLATLALCGVPPLSGFYSKDEILAQAYHHSVGLFILGFIVSILTTFYMFRLVFVVFYGRNKGEHGAHAHESPRVMTWPLIILAVPSVLAGFWGIDQIYARKLAPAAGDHSSPWIMHLFQPFNHAPAAALAGLLAIFIGYVLARQIYWNADRDILPEKLGMLSRAMRDRFYFDEIYERLILWPHDLVAKLASALDRWVVGGLFVRGVHGGTELFGRGLRLLQTGNLQTYAFLFVAGLALLLLIVLGR